MVTQRSMPGEGRSGLVMFAQGDRVFPIDDLGGGVWSRQGTVLDVHAAPRPDYPASSGADLIYVDSDVAPPVAARATVLWDDGSAEVVAEDQLCLVYDQSDAGGIRVVTAAMTEPVDVVQHGAHVVLVLREALLSPADLAALRTVLRRVRARVVPSSRAPETSPAQERRRDLDLLKALVAQLTGG
jgi:hypothetical protein